MDTIKKGIYNLVIYLNKSREIKIGKLGIFFFKRGYYVYTGSAQNSLPKRVERHLSKDKKMHWHADYLLEHANVKKVYIIDSEKKNECKISDEIGLLPESHINMVGFGSSDCSCKSHLHYFNKLPSFKDREKNSVLQKMQIYRSKK